MKPSVYQDLFEKWSLSLLHVRVVGTGMERKSYLFSVKGKLKGQRDDSPFEQLVLGRLTHTSWHKKAIKAIFLCWPLDPHWAFFVCGEAVWSMYARGYRWYYCGRRGTNSMGKTRHQLFQDIF